VALCSGGVAVVAGTNVGCDGCTCRGAVVVVVEVAVPATSSSSCDGRCRGADAAVVGCAVENFGGDGAAACAAVAGRGAERHRGAGCVAACCGVGAGGGDDIVAAAATAVVGDCEDRYDVACWCFGR